MLIETFNLGKIYPSSGWLSLFGKNGPGTTALSGVDLRLPPGTITGLTGPNGAGKSTLLRILSGRLTPDTGTIALDGTEADDAALRSRAALAETGTRNFYPRLSAADNLYFFGALYGLSRAAVRERTGALMGPLGIGSDDLEKRVDALSEGAAQKLSLARALLRRASALFLDEPARNLDLQSAAGFSALIKDLAAKEGLAVLYAAHNPEELAKVCRRVLVMENGKIKG